MAGNCFNRLRDSIFYTDIVFAIMQRKIIWRTPPPPLKIGKVVSQKLLTDDEQTDGNRSLE